MLFHFVTRNTLTLDIFICLWQVNSPTRKGIVVNNEQQESEIDRMNLKYDNMSIYMNKLGLQENSGKTIIKCEFSYKIALSFINNTLAVTRKLNIYPSV